MSKNNYQFTEQATRDMDDIWLYTLKQWSWEQANKYYMMIDMTCRNVAKNPFLVGENYEYLGRGIRGIKVGKHIIFFHRLRDGMVEIVRVVHGRRRILPSMFTGIIDDV